MSDPAFHDHAAASRFELRLDGGTVTADYAREPGALVIRYVFAPPALRGTGASDRLMSEIAALARAEGVHIRALCGYARRWLEAHRAHRDLLVQ